MAFWFPLYVNDFLGSTKVATMTTEEIGAYMLLLCHEWQDPKCSLPTDEVILKKLGRISGNISAIRACFSEKHGRLVNRRLYKEWKKAKHIKSMTQRAARMRWHSDRNANALRSECHSQSQSQSHKEKKDTREIRVSNGRDYRHESKEVLAFLNLKTAKKFREVDATLAPIEARLKSGVDLQACKTLIARKVRDWLTDPKMARYLRPETLFNKTKFETYLAEVTT